MSREMANLSKSVSTLLQLTLIKGRVAGHRLMMRKKKMCSYIWGPSLVHPESAVGNVSSYAKVQARKESTKEKTVSIEREERRRRNRVKGEKLSFKHVCRLDSNCSP